MKDLIIIGAGPVGLYAGFCAGLRKLDAMVIESSYEIGGQLTLYHEKDILDVPGFPKIKAKDLSDSLFKQFQTYGDIVSLHTGEDVTEIHKKNDYFEVMTSKGQYETRKVLIANGGGKFSPRIVEGLEADNVYYHICNVERFRDQDVAVLGGGDSAVDWALALLNEAKSVTLIHRREEFRAHQSSLDLFKARGGKILANHVVWEYVTDGHVVTSLKLMCNADECVRQVKTDALCIFFGLTKTKVNYADWQLTHDPKGIRVNQAMETSIEGIYAVGNAASYDGKQDMLTSGFGEVVTAIGAINFSIHPEQKVPMYSSLINKK